MEVGRCGCGSNERIDGMDRAKSSRSLRCGSSRQKERTPSRLRCFRSFQKERQKRRRTFVPPHIPGTKKKRPPLIPRLAPPQHPLTHHRKRSKNTTRALPLFHLAFSFTGTFSIPQSLAQSLARPNLGNIASHEAHPANSQSA
ncbi:hypothetical protein K491DRAFT_329739 [Lophiostoma macrostomum CBS 122681]|uniref:Uncharacterized protein n=1 Tax=Lophiostoma macrostomum CBS 122681 TaxID=1314788 RepID=A0A6A6TEA0_9PLEO|nr:hypothetical protein K491DRAFT_329739 [Lophiostoma macrostomum CBS 122681]